MSEPLQSMDLSKYAPGAIAYFSVYPSDLDTQAIRRIEHAEVLGGKFSIHHDIEPAVTIPQKNMLLLGAMSLQNATIADKLSLETDHVKQQQSLLLGRLGARNRYQAVARAFEVGIFQTTTKLQMNLSDLFVRVTDLASHGMGWKAIGANLQEELHKKSTAIHTAFGSQCREIGIHGLPSAILVASLVKPPVISRFAFRTQNEPPPEMY